MMKNLKTILTVFGFGLLVACSSDDEGSNPNTGLLLPSAITSTKENGEERYLERYTYDSQNRLTKIESEENDVGEIEQSEITFTYEADKLIMVNIHSSELYTTDVAYRYTYTGDKLSYIMKTIEGITQVLTVETENGRITKMTSPKEELSFVYDKKGNLIKEVSPILLPGATESYEYIYDTTKESIFRNVNTPFELTVFIDGLSGNIYGSPNLPIHSRNISSSSPETIEDALFIWSDFKEDFPHTLEVGNEGEERIKSTIEYTVSK